MAPTAVVVGPRGCPSRWGISPLVWRALTIAAALAASWQRLNSRLFNR
jgi:hypothetical protein